MSAAATNQQKQLQQMVANFIARRTETASANTVLSYSAGNRVTAQIPRNWPLWGIQATFSGTVNVTSALTLTDQGVLGLISEFGLLLDGVPIFRMPGWALPFVNQVDTKNAGTLTDVGTTVASHDFNVGFAIPTNAFKDLTGLLDASDAAGHRTLEVYAQFATGLTGVYSAGTATVTSATIALKAVQNVGFPASQSQPGGLTFPYWIRSQDFTLTNLSGANSALPIDLAKKYAYLRVVLVTKASAARVDTVLNNVTLNVNSKPVQTWTVDELVSNQLQRYNIGSADWTGIYVVDFTPNAQMRDLCIKVANSSDVNFQLALDVNNVASSSVYTLHDRFVLPPVA